MPGKRGYNEHPTQMEKMHCLAFVISAMVISAMDPDMVKKFKDIRNEARERGGCHFDSLKDLYLEFFCRASTDCHPDKNRSPLQID